ncbi:CCN family member 1 isoform X2 [Chelonia mydas]|uniref:CCN family member 1 isoform X2 n=1 Tax=Chelonia mydas TaxID=8469 RepID=UPI001CAA3234|nr:CCN family member 1 isoform X2 [Chelonia mydas]
MEQASLLSFVFLLCLALVACRCPLQCLCPLSPPHCAPGVSMVLDGCGCCKICARQLNDDCSKHWPCDPHRGLECNFGADPLASKGICRAKQEGRTCQYNGRIYQNGENFQPSCKHQCSCMDGAVGCLPLCPLEMPLASLSCPDPQLLKVPGQCCKKFVCSKGAKRFGEVSFEGRETNSNELIYVGKDGHWKNLPAWAPLFKAHSVLRNCLTQTTDWSPCSKTCGLGASTRVTNNNPQCKLAKETQLCQIQPCSQPDFTKLKLHLTGVFPSPPRRRAGSVSGPRRRKSWCIIPMPAARASASTSPATVARAWTGAAACPCAPAPWSCPSTAPMGTPSRAASW